MIFQSPGGSGSCAVPLETGAEEHDARVAASHPQRRILARDRDGQFAIGAGRGFATGSNGVTAGTWIRSPASNLAVRLIDRRSDGGGVKAARPGVRAAIDIPVPAARSARRGAAGSASVNGPSHRRL